MKKIHLRIALGLALLAPLLGTAGCTESEPLTSTVGNVIVDVGLVNTDSQFEFGGFNIAQITLRPVDPDASAVLAQDIGMLLEPLQIDITSPATFGATIPATVGAFELKSIQLQQLSFLDLDPPVGQATCEDYVTTYSFNMTPNLSLTKFGEPIYISVVNGAANRLTVTLDVAALTEAFVDSWICRQNCLDLGPPIVLEPWCLETFLRGDFDDAGPTFLSFD